MPKKCLQILGLRCQEDPFIDRFVFDRLGMFLEVPFDPVAFQDCHPEAVTLSLHPHEGVDRQEMVVVEDVLLKIRVGWVEVQELTIPEFEKVDGESPILPMLIGVIKSVGVLAILSKRPGDFAVLVGPDADKQGVCNQIILGIERVQ